MSADLLLTEDQVVALSGGYKRHAEQLRELHARGYFRAVRSKLSGRVDVAWEHVRAVDRAPAPTETSGGVPCAVPNWKKAA